MTKSNKEIALEVLTRAFTDRDPTVVEQLFSVNYKQHNPAIPDGPAAIGKMIPTLTNLRYEPGMAVAEGSRGHAYFSFDALERPLMARVQTFKAPQQPQPSAQIHPVRRPGTPTKRRNSAK